MTVGAISANTAISTFLAGERAASHAAPPPRIHEVAPPSAAKEISHRDARTNRQASVESEARGGKGAHATAEARRVNTGPSGANVANDRTEPSTLFLVQLLGQDGRRNPGPGLPEIEQVIRGHRDAAAMGSLYYRRAGGEPGVLRESATFLRIAI